MSAGRSKVSLNSSRPLRAFPREGTFLDESPALTAVLQAQPGRIVPSSAARRAGTRAGGGGGFRPVGGLEQWGAVGPMGGGGRVWGGRIRLGRLPAMARSSCCACAPYRAAAVWPSAARSSRPLRSWRKPRPGPPETTLFRAHGPRRSPLRRPLGRVWALFAYSPP